MKYIDAEKLITEIERRIEEYNIQSLRGAELSDLLSFITDLQQEQARGIDGVVHQALSAHWVVTDQKQLATVLKGFPEGAEVELFIFARKEDEK